MKTDASLRWQTRINYAGRVLRVELYDDGTALCSCRRDGCDHVAYARRLRDQPAIVALEQLRDSYVLDGCVFDDEAKAKWANGAYRLVTEALTEQGRAMDAAMWRLHRDEVFKTQSGSEILAEAIAQFQTPGGPSSPIESEWGTHGHTTPADIQTTHLGAGSTYDPAIHQEP